MPFHIRHVTPLKYVTSDSQFMGMFSSQNGTPLKNSHCIICPCGLLPYVGILAVNTKTFYHIQNMHRAAQLCVLSCALSSTSVNALRRTRTCHIYIPFCYAFWHVQLNPLFSLTNDRNPWSCTCGF